MSGRQIAGLFFIAVAFVVGIVAFSMSETFEVKGESFTVIMTENVEFYGGEQESCSDWYMSSRIGKDGKKIRKTWVKGSQDKADCLRAGGKIVMEIMQKSRTVPYPMPISYVMIVCLLIFGGGALAVALPSNKRSKKKTPKK